jgi:hypothetical protein
LNNYALGININTTFAPFKIMQKICVFFMLMVLSVSLTHAQRSGDFGLLGGVTYYMGDLNPSVPFRLSKPAFGLLYRQNFNTRISLRGHAFRGNIAGSDAVSGVNPERDLNFESKITEAGLQVEINFYEFFIGSKQHPITPYLFGGVAVFFFKPYGNVQGVKTELQPLATEGQGTAVYPDRKIYNLYSFSLPLGLGVKYSIGKLVGIGAEWGMRKTLTDYIDDVSQTYYLNNVSNPPATASEAILASDPLLNHEAGMQRGNSQNKDWYSYAGISLTVKIKMLKKENCLDIQH